MKFAIVMMMIVHDIEEDYFFILPDSDSDSDSDDF